MIDLPLTEPEKIGLIRILLDFLPIDYGKRPMIEAELSRREKGYQGEKEVDFFLRQLPNKPFHILNGLRLECDGDHFQIDNLILTTRFALIDEIKNYSRKIIYDMVNDQFTHIKFDGTKDRSKNPIEQAARQRRCFYKWLIQNGFAQLPIFAFVVSSNPHTIIETIPENPRHMPNLFNAEMIVDRVLKIDASCKKEIMKEEELKKLIKALKKAHCPLTYDLLKEYDIPYSDLQMGVECPECGERPMKRKYGGWLCLLCGCRSKTAHKATILKRLKLVKPYITNQECRELLKVDSEDLIRRILLDLDLEVRGKNKSRTYHKR